MLLNKIQKLKKIKAHYVKHWGDKKDKEKYCTVCNEKTIRIRMLDRSPVVVEIQDSSREVSKNQ